MLLATFYVQQNFVATVIVAFHTAGQRLTVVVDACRRDHAVLENWQLAGGDEATVAHVEHAKRLAQFVGCKKPKVNKICNRVFKALCCRFDDATLSSTSEASNLMASFSVIF